MNVLQHHDGAASSRGIGPGRRARPPHVRPVDPIEVERAVLQLRRRLDLRAETVPTVRQGRFA